MVESSNPVRGRIICAGLGPGDPDLMSVKADRAVRGASHVAFFRKAGREGQARRIVDGMLRHDVVEMAMEYPVTTEIPVSDPRYNKLLSAFYDEWTDRLVTLSQKRDVLVLCEGDPFFYGSFMHLHSRLQGRATVEVIPGITGMSGCWTATDAPITWGDDVLTVLTATLPEAELTRQIAKADAAVVMKIGTNIDKLKRAFENAGRLEDAWLVERGTMPGQTVRRLALIEGRVPYFSIAILHGRGRRP